MNWVNWALSGWTVRIAGGGVLVSAVVIVLSQTVFAPAHEVLYKGSMTVAHCFHIKQRETCVFTYALSVGNTGEQPQDIMRIVWPLDMRGWEVGTQVADIVASASKTQQAKILQTFESDHSVFEIAALMPNNLVDFRIRCLDCTRSDVQAMRDARVTIEARGVVSEADPRVSALRRGAMNLLKVIGLFR